MADIATLNGVAEDNVAIFSGAADDTADTVNGVTWPHAVVNNSGLWVRSQDDKMTQTFSSSGDDQKMTIAFWLKRSVTTNQTEAFLSAGTTPESQIKLFNDNVRVNLRDGANNTDANIAINDTNWHQLTFHFDTANATAADRLKLWVDGTLAGWSGTLTQNINTLFGDNVIHRIGDTLNDIQNLDALVTHYYRIDGSLVAYTNFIDGSGSPLDYTTDPGTNGWKLIFENASDLGEDSSTQGNDWTNSGVTQSSTVPT